LGAVFSFIVRLLFHLGVKDTQCGFKLFRKEPAKRIFSMLKTDGFAFDVEALLLARKLGYKIKEVPVKWVDKRGSKVRLGHSLRMLEEVLRLRF
jgi:dolichyl-phosphate beta-glucosyltransferase